MSALLLDTQAVVWMLFSPDKLSETARQAIDAAHQKGETLYVSALSLVELTFLVEKGRLPQIVLDTLTDELMNLQGDLVAAPVDVAVAQKVKLIQRSEIPELPDRVIAATALSLGLSLITSDLKIRASGVSTIW